MKSHPRPRPICVACKLEKQPLKGALFTENCFSEALGNNSSRRVILVMFQMLFSQI